MRMPKKVLDPEYRKTYDELADELGGPGIELSERDSLRVLRLLENPPKPTAKLRAAAKRHHEIFGR